ncbi:MAG: P-II family nitrogen regulator [Deltaproteobacteria bacterium]|nr:P-II family nitrogen regulator [Deltaproteobacteria bacterium]MBW2111846.1 P-II family nitrogen regulator [Deltaproteobacteria bacterium]MBW2352456.1 P-II family nitrogen regulator [Deltaproteobacteria bacterium]HDZ89886.1 P-II family nitrogen regulator [Deltaproteobacteria bacterium]
MKFKLIMATVKADVTDGIVDAAKAAGATGATIIPAHGVGIHEAKTFFGLTLEAQTDVVMFLLEEHLVDEVMEAIQKAGRFEKPGTGIAFVLPVDRAAGLESQMESFKKRLTPRSNNHDTR